jgi:hypothetical protein
MMRDSFKSLDDPFGELMSRAIKSEIVDDVLIATGDLDDEGRAVLEEEAPKAAKRLAERAANLLDSLRVELSDLHPMALIVRLLWGNVVTSQTYFEPTHTGSEARVEVLAGLLMTAEDLNRTASELPDPARVQEVFDRLEELELVMRLRVLAANHDRSADGAALRVLSQLRWLGVRGDSYVQHATNLAVQVLDPLEEEMRERLGFGIRDLIRVTQTVDHLMEKKLNLMVRASGDNAKAFAAAVEAGEIKDELFLDVLRSEGRSGLLMRELIVQAESAMLDALTFSPEEVIQEDEQTADYLDSVLQLLCTELGSLPMERFRTPFDLNPISVTPFVEWQGRIALPVPGVLMRDYLGVLEPVLMQSVPSYPKHRGAALERIAVGLVTEALPGAEAFSNLYYQADGPDGPQRVELDALVLFDRFAIVVEAKSTPLSVQASRGDVLRMKRDLERSVEKAGAQAARAIAAINSNDAITFEDESGDPLVTVRSEELEQIFAIAPSLHAMGGTAVVPEMLRSLGLFENIEPPWSVFVNDLLVVVDICQNPAEFLHYMVWRARLPLGDRVVATDELDVFGAFLLAEDVTDRLTREPDLHMNLGSYTTDFDDYYLWRPELGIPRPSKPRRFTVDMLRRFVKSECDSQLRGWLERCGVALDMTIENLAVFETRRKPVLERIDPLETRLDGRGSLALIGLGHEVNPSDVLGDLIQGAGEANRMLLLQRVSGKPRVVDAVDLREIRE